MNFISLLLFTLFSPSNLNADQFWYEFNTLANEVSPRLKSTHCKLVKLGNKEDFIYTADTIKIHFRRMAELMQNSAVSQRDTTLSAASQICSEFQSTAENNIQKQSTEIFQNKINELPKQIIQRAELVEIIAVRISEDIKREIIRDLKQQAGKK